MKIDFLDNKIVRYDEIERILLDSKKKNHYTNDGPVKRKLEDKLGRLLCLNNNKRVLCCNNGTTALHCLMFYCSYKHKITNWVTPAFTFPSCMVGHNFNIDVLDIDPNTHTLILNSKILSKYDGIIITNLFGSRSNLYQWSRLCSKNNKILIFDNAASPLSTFHDINICNFGDYSFGSLHHTKYMGFGEGGFIVVPKEDYEFLMSLTNFGFFGSKQYNTLSSNFKMSDISAAFILDHINNYDFGKHLHNQNLLINGIHGMSHVKAFNYKPGTVYNTFPVVFDHPVHESYFCDLGITAHKYYKPLLTLPAAYDLYSKIINFPLYAGLSKEQINYIIETIGGAK
jgi:dTDP-4-amino-4,6-dideoxygalactose transaminase